MKPELRLVVSPHVDLIKDKYDVEEFNKVVKEAVNQDRILREEGVYKTQPRGTGFNQSAAFNQKQPQPQLQKNERTTMANFPPQRKYSKLHTQGQRLQKCFKCQKPGHFARDCRAPTPIKQGGYQQ